MPNITEVYKNAKDVLTDTSVIRLHGTDRKRIEKETNNLWHNIIHQKDDELGEITNMIISLNFKGSDIYVNVNNHYEGSAILTINKINNLLS